MFFKENPILVIISIGLMLFFGASYYFVHEFLPENLEGDIIFEKT